MTGPGQVTTIQAYSIEYFNSTITDNFTYQRGNHSYKMGVLFAFERKNENANNQTQGSFAFPTVSATGRTGFQSFLMGNRDGVCGPNILTQFRHEGGRLGTYTLNYTLSRNQATASNDRDAVDLPQNPLDLEAEFADARSDRRHIFNATYIYEIPFFRDSTNQFLKGALGGRRGNQATQTGEPQIVNLFPVWFDASVFKPNADGTYGNSGRGPLRLPGRNQTDLALSKNFYAFEKRVQFRADFLNAFNHTQWTSVNADCSGTTDATLTCASFPNSTVGQITGARNPREIQLSLKLYW